MSGEKKRLGILGGGQLARMLAQAATKVDVRPSLLVASDKDCALQVCEDATLDDGLDQTLKTFCESNDVVIIENEFVDLKRLSRSLGRTPLYPSLDCLGLVQNKFDQKLNLASRGLDQLDFLPVKSLDDLEVAHRKMGDRIVLKKGTMGYDGKGTFIFGDSRPLKPVEFWSEFTQSQGVSFQGYAEPSVDFEKELAVIVARSQKGETRAYPVVETHQDGGVCLWAVAPAEIESRLYERATKLAVQVISSFEGVGVFGIEMFLLKDGRIVVNEIAPRVHNSGHLTMDACDVGQFEMHLRAILGMDIPQPELLFPAAAMVNILGEDAQVTLHGGALPLRESTPQKGVWYHWYGKSGQVKGRKLGHINVVGSDPKDVLKKALALRRNVLI